MQIPSHQQIYCHRHNGYKCIFRRFITIFLPSGDCADKKMQNIFPYNIPYDPADTHGTISQYLLKNWFLSTSNEHGLHRTLIIIAGSTGGKIPVR
jgi:hypothetical protein